MHNSWRINDTVALKKFYHVNRLRKKLPTGEIKFAQRDSVPMFVRPGPGTPGQTAKTTFKSFLQVAGVLSLHVHGRLQPHSISHWDSLCRLEGARIKYILLAEFVDQNIFCCRRRNVSPLEKCKADGSCYLGHVPLSEANSPGNG